METQAHKRTPALSVIDSRGLPVRQVAYLRTVSGETAQALITHLHYDAAGRGVAQQDPRLSTPNIRSVYGLSSAPLKVDSVDASWRLNLPGLAGEILQRWDARGSHWRMTYDEQLRAVATEENGQQAVETLRYADAWADPNLNLRGQLLEQTDESGRLDFDSYGVLGVPLSQTRTFQDGKAFTSHHVYGADGAMLEQTDAGGHRQQLRYDLAGQLKRSQLQLNGQTGWQPVLVDAQYNAAGHIIEQYAGNGVVSRWHYDLANGRLHRQFAQLAQQPMLQDFEYVYDPVGNVTRILDHAFTLTHFANQRVDGHRDFAYDSLYRLHSASGYDDSPPSDNPGRPIPTDPNDRRNYLQTYAYDSGDNLIETCHVRDGACHTWRIAVDPRSNRGVRWAEGDPPPDFDTLFDRHGNLHALQPGQPLRWNARDELASVTFLGRDNGLDDAEVYHYSQGVRVYKRHEFFNASNSHFHEVRYLPGLEIRSKDDGETLHVITIAAGFASVRYLHWETDPGNVGTDHIRYTLGDHLGSCTMELDHRAQVVSHEGYYPFGATAWMIARSLVEVAYKFVRFSGKEMDASGLYYYGARYYAPWLQRWISADPAGIADGLNLYGFVGNNPIGYVDDSGHIRETTQERDERKAKSAASRKAFEANMRLSRGVYRLLKILEVTDLRIAGIESQLDNLQSSSALAGSAAKRSASFIGKQAITYGVGIGVGVAAGTLGAVAGPVGTAFGIVLGFAAKTGAGIAIDFVTEKQGLSTSVALKSRKLNPQKIVEKGEYKTASLGSYALQKYQKLLDALVHPTPLNALKAGKEVTLQAASIALKAGESPVSAEVGAVLSTLFGAAEIVYEIERANQGMTPEMQEKLGVLAQYIPDLINVLQRGESELNKQFDAAHRDSIHTFRMFSKILGKAPGDSRDSIASATHATIARLHSLHSRIYSWGI